jgi:ATP-dependent DNA helicase HFM1/MER3
MRSATIKPKIAPSMFAGITSEHEPSYPSNTSKRRTESLEVQRKQAASGDDYGDDEIDDNELMNVSFGDQEFDDIDNYANISEIAARENASKDKLNKEKSRTQPVNTAAEGDSENMPTQLSNGNRACNHRCKDKTACKHPCCRDGVEKPVKKAAKRTTQDKSESQVVSQASTLKEKKMQTKLKLTTTKRKNSHAIEELDLTQPDKKSKCDLEYANPDYRRLEQLHKSVQKNKSTPSTSSVFRERSSRAHDEGRNGLSFMQQPVVQRPQTPSDYGDMRFDDFSPEPNNYQCEPSHSDEIPACAPQMDYSAKAPLTSDTSDTFGDDDSVLGDAMIGLADSQHLASTENFSYNGMQFSEEPTGIDYGMDLHDDDFPMENDSPFDNKAGCSNAEQIDAAALLDREPRRSPSMGDKPSLQPAASMFDEPRPREPQQGKGRDASSTVHHTMSSDSQDISLDVFGTLNQPGKSQAAVKQAAPTTISVREQDLISEVVKQEMVPSAFKDLEPWLFKEFGDIVELEDE